MSQAPTTSKSHIPETAAHTYDVVVIGGGPGGSTVAALCAEKGLKTLMVEREQFPRFHIGESLIPDTYWILERLGMLEKMKSSHFVKKYSVKFVGTSGRESAPFYFRDTNPHECSQTWQVLRSEFDLMLMDNARDKGAVVWQKTNVTDILLEPTPTDILPKATGVVLQREGGPYERVDAKVVVDATGNVAMLSKKLNIRNRDPKLKKAAFFAHFKGALRDPGIDEGATLVCSLVEQNGWFWYIPLHNDIISVGVVADVDYLLNKERKGTPAQILAEEIKRCPAIERRVKDAQIHGEIRVLSDFSYRASRCAGEGWVLVGDAFGFLDPMYSSGVLLALKSGQLAADAIIDAFKTGDFSPARLSTWGSELSTGMSSIRKLVYCYYSKGFTFGQFMKAVPQQRDNVTKILIGDVFRPGAEEVFVPLSEFVQVPESIPLDPPPGVEAVAYNAGKV